MSLVQKLHNIGKLVTKNDIYEIIKINDFEDLSSYRTVRIDLSKGKLAISEKALDIESITFSKKIGGTSNSYYLYPNFDYKVEKSKKKDLYTKFKASVHTLDNSILAFSDIYYQSKVREFINLINSYKEDRLSLKDYPNGNYFLILTIDGQIFDKLMPEIYDNYYYYFVSPHILDEKKRKINNKQVKTLSVLLNDETVNRKDVITSEKVFYGYDPDIKFFTMDNYHDKYKSQILNKLPMHKETAKNIKKGWMYALKHLKFYHRGLEYMIIPSMVMHDDKVYEKLLHLLKKSVNYETQGKDEASFPRRIQNKIKDIDPDIFHSISLDILFTDVNMTNLSVKIFASLEDVLPSRINQLVETMESLHVTDSIKFLEDKKEYLYLRDYFSRDELFAIAKKNTGSMKNRILQERIYLAKLLLGYAKINFSDLLQRCEHEREYDFEHKRRLEDGIKKWMINSQSVVSKEEHLIDFLNKMDAIHRREK